MHFSLLGAFVSLLPGAAFAASYARTTRLVGSDFYNYFQFEAIPDPTHGRVEYVDQATAQSLNLTFASSDTFIMRADYTSTLTWGGPGRKSVRLLSNQRYSTHVAVFDIRHMPQGCGTWPAIWETNGPLWPTGGEIDIVEGVNDATPNSAVLHTIAGCEMPATRDMTGTSTGNNCDNYATGYAGCGVQFPTSNSYGPPFNSNGGGWFVLERTNEAIKIWFWPRNASNVPANVRNAGSSIDTSAWGTPGAHFPNTMCNISERFAPHNLIINLTFCGDWAGSVYPWSGCPSSCEDYVNNNPAAFAGAYFDFASINIYE